MRELINKRIGENLRAMRKVRGLNQTELGKLLKISAQQIQKYEIGINQVSAVTLFVLSKKLDFPMELFYKGTNEMLKGAKYPLETLRIINKFAQIKNESARKSIEDLIELMVTIH